MGQNEKMLLDQLLATRKTKIAPELNEGEFFEFFVAEELLKNYGLEYDEIDSGIIGGGGDGGIDALYGFVENSLIKSDFDVTDLKDEPVIELIIIQAKRSSSFQEKTIHSLVSTMDDLLDMNKSVESLGTVYNSELLGIIRDFRAALLKLADKFPIIKVSFYYATKGNSESIHPNVLRRVEALKRKVSEMYTSATTAFEFLGAREVLELARRRSVKSMKLNVRESLVSEGESIICLVTLRDYFRFITDENSQRRQSIFDVNVREYEGSVEVNKAIRKTLAEANSKVNFWWLNNGITIVASKAPLIGKTLTLENAKVVNGLQTSQEIFRHFTSGSEYEDDRLILVKVIVTGNEDIRNEIIKATNNQTKILSYSLRATEKIHHDIEQFFSYNGLFYDRQKNYYKNLGKPKSKIISMQYLAQAVTAILLQEPNNSRGRPTNLVKDQSQYERVFNEQYELKLYLICSQLMKLVDEYLRTDAPEYAKKEKTNLRFHLASFAAARKIGEVEITHKMIVEHLSADDIHQNFLFDCVKHVNEIFENLKEELSLDGDRIARRKEFDAKLRERLLQIFRGGEQLKITT